VYRSNAVLGGQMGFVSRGTGYRYFDKLESAEAHA